MTDRMQTVQQWQARWQALPAVPRLIIGTLALIILLAAFKPSPPQKPTVETAPRVRMELARPASFSPEVLLFGRIESPASATLSSSVTALVAETPALPGSRILAGEPILLLDPSEAQLARDQAEAALQQALAQKASAEQNHRSDQKALALEKDLTAMAEENVRRLEKLRSDSLASQSQLDESRQQLARQQLNMEARQLAVRNYRNTVERLDAEIARARAARDQAALDLARSQLSAPFDGRITALHVAVGERVRPGEPLISLYAESGVEIRAQIPQRYLPAVRRGLADGGLSGRMILEGRELTLTLKRLAGEVSRGQSGIDGLFHVDAPDLVPELGRPLELTLSLPTEDNLVAIPAAALHGLDRLYRLDDEDRLSAIRITRVGEWRDDKGERRLLVRGDIRPGDRLMVTQLPGAIDGLLVNPADKGETPLPPDADTPDDDAPEPA